MSAAATVVDDPTERMIRALPPPPTLAVHRVALSLPIDRGAFDIAAFRGLIGDVPVLDDQVSLRRRSRDYHWFSPILRGALDGRVADIVVMPRTEAEIVAVASAAARLRIPVTTRGAGTGTYGQAVPLYGGVVLDLSAYAGILSMTEARVWAKSGTRIIDIDTQARLMGRELRMHPSTKRAATLGGYFCGGSGGIGSVTWGGLREPGNMLGARVVTLEETPRIIELAGADCGLVNRTFGTTGIVVAVEAPLEAAWPWRDVVVSFPDFMDCVRFSEAVAGDPALIKKLVSVHAAESAAFLREPLGDVIRPGEAAALLMIAPRALPDVQRLAASHNGTITLEDDALAREADPASIPLYECSWGHTTLHAIRQQPDISYLQALFPPGRIVESVEAMWRRFGTELPIHLEFVRYDGKLAANGAQLWPFTSTERLEEIITIHEQEGVPIANPHVFTVEEGSRHKRVPGDQTAFKREVDPHGLLNPGKMGAVEHKG
jgi:FAD/FMN-containing dehydrogenase